LKKLPFKTIFVVVILAILTFLFANYVAQILFSGTNSLETYEHLKVTKAKLKYNIKQMQKINAKLQKDYFELKNLEPEQ